MTLTSVLWDGQSDGTAATNTLLTGNAGWGVTSPSTMQFSTSDGMRSTTGLHFGITTTGADYVRYNLNADNNNGAFSFVFRTPSSLSLAAFFPFFNVKSTSGRVASIGISTNGRLYVADGAAAGGTVNYVTPATGGTALVTSSKYRCELRLQGGSTTVGKIDFSLYSDPTSSTPLVTLPQVTNANLTANALHQVEIGHTSATPPAAFDFGIDDLQMDDGRTTEIGPILVPLTTPTVTLGTSTNPTTVGGTNGSQVISWGAVTNATTYDAYKANKASPAQSDFALVATNVTSPYTFTGLSAGTYSFGVVANP